MGKSTKKVVEKAQEELKTFLSFSPTRMEARKYRIILNPQQQEFFARNDGCCRLVYNFMLDLQLKKYKTAGKFLTIKELGKKLTALKKKKENAFLKEADSISLQQAMKIANETIRSCSKYKNGWVHFKSKKEPRHSFTTMIVNKNIHFDKNDNLKEANKKSNLTLLKSKFGNVKCIRHRALNGKLCQKVVIVREENNQYFVCFFVEVKQNNFIKPDIKKSVGIDLGVRKYFTDSNENQIAKKYFHGKLQQEILHLKRVSEHIKSVQSALSKLETLHKIPSLEKKKKEITFKNYLKLRSKFHNLQMKANRIKEDINWKIAIFYATHYDIIGVENLAVSEMKKNHYVAKEIQVLPFYAFKQKLLWECQKLGKYVFFADKYDPSSQKCCKCGKIHKEMKNGKHTMICECGNKVDRDLNAAINLKNEAIKQFKNLTM